MAETKVTPTEISNPYKFSVYANTAQSIDSTFTNVVNYNTVTYDTSSSFNTTTHAFVAPISGYYQFNAHVGFVSAGNTIEVAIGVNGTNVKRGTFGVATAAIVAASVKLNAGDSVTIIGYSSTAQNTAGSADISQVYFDGYLVSTT
jgi:hypothetical protein